MKQLVVSSTESSSILSNFLYTSTRLLPTFRLLLQQQVRVAQLVSNLVSFSVPLLPSLSLSLSLPHSFFWLYHYTARVDLAAFPSISYASRFVSGWLFSIDHCSMLQLIFRQNPWSWLKYIEPVLFSAVFKGSKELGTAVQSFYGSFIPNGAALVLAGRS